MVKNHLSRLNAPKSWSMKRKGIKFITRPNSGLHSLRESMPLSLILTNLLKYARTRKEVKKILNEKKVIINGKVRKSLEFAVGLMDVISVPSLDESYRVYYNHLGKFQLLPIKGEEIELKPVKIENKTVLKGGKFQINNTDGTNLILDKNDYVTGDTLIISLKDGKIKEHLQFKKGAKIFITAGNKIGTMGVIDDIKENKIMVKTKDSEFETLKKYAFVIGKLQTIEEK